jgi:hypothetical protein
MDFEEALGNGWNAVFPDSAILRDFFHLQVRFSLMILFFPWHVLNLKKQAIRRKLEKLGYKDMIDVIVQEIRGLFCADTQLDETPLLVPGLHSGVLTMLHQVVVVL